MSKSSVGISLVVVFLATLGCTSESGITITNSPNGKSISVKIGNHPMTVGSGNVTTEERAVADFAHVVNSGAANLEIVPGDYSLTITADDNIQPLITSRVENGKLILGSEGSYSTSSGVLIKVSMPELLSAKLNGSGDMRFAEFSGDTLAVNASGSGNVNFSGMDYGKMDVKVQGSGNVSGSGNADSVTTSIAGSGNVKLTELPARSVTAKVSGSGNVSVAPSENLTAQVFGSGNITYQKNNRLTVEKQVAGSGQVYSR